MDFSFRLWLEDTISQSVKTDAQVSAEYRKLEANPFLHNFNNVNPQVLQALKKWIAYHTVHTDPYIIYKLGDKHILFDPEDKYNLKQKLNRLDYNISNLEVDNKTYHANLAKLQKRTYTHPVRFLTDLPPINGLQWVSLDKESCKNYGDSMGHCGNAAGKSGDNILSLMDPKTNMHYLTFIDNDGVLGESKGQNNQKPAAKFHPNIKQLLLSRYINVIKGAGYKPENNFELRDLPEQDQQEILAIKPHIDNYVGHLNKHAPNTVRNRSALLQNKNISDEDRTLLSDPRWHQEEGEGLMFDKTMSNEDFVNLVSGFVKATGAKVLTSIAGEFRRRGLINEPLFANFYKKIVSSPEASFRYATHYLKPKDTPPEIIQSIASDGRYATSYGAEILRGQNVPDPIMKAIVKNHLGEYIYGLKHHEYEIPDDVLKLFRSRLDAQLQLYNIVDNMNESPSWVYDILSPQGAEYVLANKIQGGYGYDAKLFRIAYPNASSEEITQRFYDLEQGKLSY